MKEYLNPLKRRIGLLEREITVILGELLKMSRRTKIMEEQLDAIDFNRLRRGIIPFRLGWRKDLKRRLERN